MRRGEEKQGSRPTMEERSRYCICSMDGEEEEHEFVVRGKRRER
jgi:hypothetical protein